MRGFLFFAALSTLIPLSVQGAGREAVLSENENVERLDSLVV